MNLLSRSRPRMCRAERSGVIYRSIAVVAAIAMATATQAATITVTTNADAGAGSLRQAIATSNSGDTINFAPALNGLTITLTTGELLVSHNLTITGPGTNLLFVSGNNASRVFNFSTGTSSLSGLTVTMGNAMSGGGIYNAGTLTLTDSEVMGNVASGNGGGIFSDGGALSVTNSTVSGNTAYGGGGIYGFLN